MGGCNHSILLQSPITKLTYPGLHCVLPGAAAQQLRQLDLDMATAPSPPKDANRDRKGKILCRYFVHGACWYGDGCRFSHNLHDKPNLVCTFHKKGQCAYGKECRYDHVRERRERHGDSNSSSIAPTTKNLNASFTSHDETWADAAEFVPGASYSPRVVSSYSGIVKTNMKDDKSVESGFGENPSSPTEELCPYYLVGECPNGDNCFCLHGLMCDMCGLRILHPYNKDQQEKHKSECLASHEEDMKVSFNVAESAKVTCGICMEVVWEKKEKQNQKFGILENCNHSYCLECIRKWRSAKSFQNTVVRACPECRVPSSFVTPSEIWVTDPEDKKKLIDGYKSHLAKKPCKHFDQGRGQCPFGANCFYLHAYPDGTKQDRSKIPRRARNADGAWKDMDLSTIWRFIEDRDISMIDVVGAMDEDDLDFFDLVYLLGVDQSSDDDMDSLDWYMDSDDNSSDSMPAF